ncbi:MAG: glycosyltransferase family 2 protein, partial [Planctomycetota bacterium]
AQVLVCDNGSTDQTRAVVTRHGADWVYEPRRGYGAACAAGIERLDRAVEIVVFLDADLSHDPARIPDLVGPIAADRYDLVLACRDFALREAGSTTLPQRFANRLFPVLMSLGWGHRYRDMGPFRAVRRSSLEAMNMQDRGYGWTVEMQIRAVELGLRILEIPVPLRRRRYGKSKVSGNAAGIMRAAWGISTTCARYWLTKRRRLSMD